jgi:hypothetical protein
MMDRKIIMALEASPRVDLPADFAAKVAAKMPPRTAAAITPTCYGVGATLACLVALTALMLGFSPLLVQDSAHWVSIQTAFCAQFVLLAVWLIARRYYSPGRL